MPNILNSPMIKGIHGITALVLAFMTFCNTNSQTFRVGNLNTLEHTAFDPNTQNIYAIWKDSMRIHQAPDYKESILKVFHAEPGLYPTFAQQFHALFLNGRLHFVHRGDGLVLEVTGDSLKKIDRSTQLKMQNSSAVFVQNDTIFRFGGGGFWTFWNYLTYFDPTSKEWEIILPESTDQAVPGLTNLLVSHSEDKIFVFSGRLQDKINPINSHQNHEVWSFDKKQNRWELKGTSSLLFGGESLIAHMGSRVLVQLNNEFILLDPENNRASYHRRLPVLGNLIDNRVIKSFYNKGLFFIVHYETLFAGASLDRELVYEVITESDFLGEPYKVEPLYIEDSFPLNWLLSGTTLLILGGAIVVGRKRKIKTDKIKVRGAIVSFLSQSIELGKAESSLLNLLLQQSGIASNEEIFALLKLDNLKDSQKQMEKNRVLDSLNLSLKILIQEDRDLIQVLQSAKDRRIKNYTLDISKFKLH